MGSKIELHTLGDALIKVGEKEVRPTSPMVFAALLYLGVERGRRVPRAALQELLFPNASERSGAHSLRQLLYKLRRLGAPIEADANGVVVDSRDVRDCTTEFLALGESAFLENNGFVFLPNYSPDISEAYGDWLNARASSVTTVIRQRLVRALGGRRTALDWPAVERFARLILEGDPYHEEATLALAEAAASTGSKRLALETLNRYERDVGRGLALPATMLKRRITETVPPQGSPDRTPFVGRGSDAGALHERLNRARARQSTASVVVGEAGIGKSRLVEEVLRFASLEGFVCKTVKCQPQHALRPLSVFIELVPALLASRGALGVSPHSLARLNLLVSHDDVTVDRPADARDDSSRSSALLAAIRDLIDAVASEAPLVLAIEDVHWADTDSLLQLVQLSRTGQRRLAVICTTRRLDALTNIVALDEGIAIRRLTPIAPKWMEELGRHLLPDDREEIVNWCINVAAGNPLFLEMLCAHYASTGQAFAVPPDLLAATARRIEQLQSDCRLALEYSALLARHCTIDALRSLTNFAPTQLVIAVRRLEDEGYLLLQDEAIRLAHDLITESVLSLLPPVTKRLMHSSVAELLEKRYGQTRDAVTLWDTSEQWALSGENGKAVEFLTRCSRHALQLGRAKLALGILERAATFAHSTSDAVAVHEEMISAAKSAGDWQKAYSAAKRWETLACESGQGLAHTSAELLAIEAHWAVHLQVNSTERLFRCIDAPQASTRHRIDAALLLVRIADEFAASDLASRAYEAVEGLLDPDSAVTADRLLPIVFHTSFGDREVARRLAQKLATDLEKLPPEERFRAAHFLVIAFSVVGGMEQALVTLSEWEALADHLEHDAWQAVLCTLGASILVNVGRIAEAEAWTAKSKHRPDPSAMASRMHCANALEFALARRDGQKALECLALLGRTVGDSLRGRAYYCSADIRIKQLSSDFICDDRARAELQAYVDSTKQSLYAGSVVMALSEDLMRRGMRDELRRLLNDYLHKGVRRELSSSPYLDSYLEFVGLEKPSFET